jgi:hypothetical protein
LLHFSRAETGVLPDHGDDGNVDLRKYIGRHDANGRDAEEQDKNSQHIESVRQSQCEANDTHLGRELSAVAIATAMPAEAAMSEETVAQEWYRLRCCSVAPHRKCHFL